MVIAIVTVTRMHYEDIKSQLRKQGTSLARIASEIGVTRQAVCEVAKGKARSLRISQAIANALGKSLSEVFDAN